MGSLLPSIITDVVMEDLEKKFVRIPSVVVLFCRYVNYILLVALGKKILHILECFNSYYDYLKFSVEYEKDHNINFLDLYLKAINF